MDTDRLEALSAARKLIRTLDAAPDPSRQAHAAISSLLRVRGWSPAQEAKLLDLARWLGERPPPTALKARCKALLDSL
jgi:plasmid stabilization system protein ParE